MLPNAEIHRPIQRGDIAQAIADGVHVVGIIDGEFQQARAVSPSELMDALRSGMRVYGAASIGALRAVELEQHGMIGVGAVFGLVKEMFGFRDDFVATTFVEEGGEVRSDSLPFVAFFLNARQLVASGAISDSAAGDLCEHYARLHFTQRNAAAFERALRAGAPNGDGLVEEMKQVFAAGNPLRDDGLALLSRIDTDLRQIEAQNPRIASLQQADGTALGPKASSMLTGDDFALDREAKTPRLLKLAFASKEETWQWIVRACERIDYRGMSTELAGVSATFLSVRSERIHGSTGSTSPTIPRSSCRKRPTRTSQTTATEWPRSRVANDLRIIVHGLEGASVELGERVADLLQDYQRRNGVRASPTVMAVLGNYARPAFGVPSESVEEYFQFVVQGRTRFRYWTGETIAAEFVASASASAITN